MYSPALFQEALDETARILSLHVQASGQTIHGILPVNGRGLRKALVSQLDTIVEQARSGHQRVLLLRSRSALLDAVAEIRAQHKAASGGLDPGIWNDSAFQIAHGLSRSGPSSAILVYYRDEFSEVPEKSRIVSHQRDEPGPARLSGMLARHADLDLSGPLRRFEISTGIDRLSPLTVFAPDPERAMARLMLFKPETPADPGLHTRGQRPWTHIREVFDAAAIRAGAEALLEEAGEPFA